MAFSWVCKRDGGVKADGPDGIAGTEDDNLRLSPGSPSIDAADNLAVPPDTADLDGDGDTTEPTPLDLDGNRRIVNRIVDMGAYEYQYEGIPAVSTVGLVVMAVVVLGVGAIMLSRRKQPVV